MINKQLITALGVVIVTLIILLGIRSVILGAGNQTRLSPASFLSGLVSQNLGVQANGTLQQPGRDFNTTISSFDNNTWLIITIDSISSGKDSTLMVVQKNNNDYKSVLGPGTAFTSNEIATLPADVASYLSSKGAVYVPVPE